jgi:hypothetical protein
VVYRMGRFFRNPNPARLYRVVFADTPIRRHARLLWLRLCCAEDFYRNKFVLARSTISSPRPLNTALAM